jgi:hypothetical protein
MNFESFLAAIHECDAAELQFNLGNKESFLFNGRWYPALAVISRAATIANDPTDYNTYRAITTITKLLPMSRIEIINYQAQEPIVLDAQGKLNQLRMYQNALNYIVGNN